jgi:hypothetical protein
MTAHVLAKAYRLLAQLPLLEACRAMSHDSSPVPFVPRSAKHVRRDTDVHGCDWHEETRSSGVETWCVWWALHWRVQRTQSPLSKLHVDMTKATASFINVVAWLG